MGTAKENERCQNAFVRCLGIHNIILSKKSVNFFLVNALRVNQTSK